MTPNTFWFLILVLALVYEITIWEVIGNLKQRYTLTHSAWFFLRISGLPVLVVVMLVMLLRPWFNG